MSVNIICVNQRITKIQDRVLGWLYSIVIGLLVPVLLSLSAFASDYTFALMAPISYHPPPQIALQYNSYLTTRDNFTLPSVGILPTLRGIPDNYLWHEIGLRYTHLSRRHDYPNRISFGVSVNYRTSSTDFVQQGRFADLVSSTNTDSGAYNRTTQIHQSALTIIPHLYWTLFSKIKLRVSAGISMVTSSRIQENISSDKALPNSNVLSYNPDGKSASIGYTDRNNGQMNCIVGVGIERSFPIYQEWGYGSRNNIVLIPSIFTEYQVGIWKTSQTQRREMISFGVGLSLQVPIELMIDKVSKFFSKPEPPPSDDDEEEYDA
jgi:hypothetical protein